MFLSNSLKKPFEEWIILTKNNKIYNFSKHLKCRKSSQITCFRAKITTKNKIDLFREFKRYYRSYHQVSLKTCWIKKRHCTISCRSKFLNRSFLNLSVRIVYWWRKVWFLRSTCILICCADENHIFSLYIFQEVLGWISITEIYLLNRF